MLVSEAKQDEAGDEGLKKKITELEKKLVSFSYWVSFRLNVY